MKNHSNSNWLGFDVKILKEGFKREWERFKTGFPQKNTLKKLFLGVSLLESREMSHESFRESQMSREWVVKAIVLCFLRNQTQN